MSAAAKGVLVEDVAPGSQAERLGIRPGDRLLRANGRLCRDLIDYMYESGDDVLELEFQRGGEEGEVFSAEAAGGMHMGLELELPRTRVCRNKCIFCFVSQLPKGLRSTLYVKDEDYRFSFLFGNYITLSNMSRADRDRILEQRLSPLYVSVHSVDPVKRRILLGKDAVPDIMRELRTLVRGGIRIHAQIVMCPGINDGRDLEKTVKALSRLYPGVESLAVVPVGLTRFHRNNLVPVDNELAEKTVARLGSLMESFQNKLGSPFVYPSDELYLKAGVEPPEASIYGDFPQIENGVGMLRDFLDRFEALEPPKRLARSMSILTFTGRSFLPFLTHAAERLEKSIKGLHLTVCGVDNEFFGRGVTVAGLLTGRDVVSRLKGVAADAVLLPSVVLREGHGEAVFLDDLTVEDMERALGIPVVVTDASPEGMLDAIVRAGRMKKTGREIPKKVETR